MWAEQLWRKLVFEDRGGTGGAWPGMVSGPTCLAMLSALKLIPYSSSFTSSDDRELRLLLVPVMVDMKFWNSWCEAPPTGT